MRLNESDIYQHKNDIPWINAPIPWQFHKCKPWTTGYINFIKIERCACGAINHQRPGEQRLWLEKNSRLKYYKEHK